MAKRTITIRLDCDDAEYDAAANMIWHQLHYGLPSTRSFEVEVDNQSSIDQLNNAWNSIGRHFVWEKRR